jgi:hypothetical protein
MVLTPPGPACDRRTDRTTHGPKRSVNRTVSYTVPLYRCTFVYSTIGAVLYTVRSNRAYLHVRIQYRVQYLYSGGKIQDSKQDQRASAMRTYLVYSKPLCDLTFGLGDRILLSFLSLLCFKLHRILYFLLSVNLLLKVLFWTVDSLGISTGTYYVRTTVRSKLQHSFNKTQGICQNDPISRRLRCCFAPQTVRTFLK